jgi:hypothetical protein
MVLTELDPSQSKLLGKSTLTALKHLSDDASVIDADGQPRTWRMARVGSDIALVDMAADDSGPRSINCYSVERERFDGIDGCKFKLDPQRLIYSLQWQHKAEPPDFELVLMQQDAALWERWLSARP